MSLYHAKLSYWKFSTRIDSKYSNKKKKKKKFEKLPCNTHNAFAEAFYDNCSNTFARRVISCIFIPEILKYNK